MSWDDGDLTQISSHNIVAASVHSRIRLSQGGYDYDLAVSELPVRLGRGEQCEVTVALPMASRVHARLVFRNGKFVLFDESTNGTFVKMAGADEVLLRRQEIPLVGRGQFGLGQPLGQAAKPVSFEVLG